MPSAEPVVQLRCYCKNDGWGKKGHDSMAARLCAKTPGTDFKIEDDKHYSEMWMGTYPTTPSYVISTGETLQEYLKKYPELLGKKVRDKFEGELPYLPKILSMSKALPLQVHPDRKMAQQLHARDPKKFGDTNHKPEIAVALGPFELFAGWKPLTDLTRLFANKPLQRFLPPGEDKFHDGTLKQVARNILEAPENVVEQTIADVIKLPDDAFESKYRYIPSLLQRVCEQYSPTDNGTLLAVLCMNFFQLNAGDSVYVPADGIHAYLSGDIVECMARSDNVLNTGFCPRAERDSVEVFCEALSFWPHEPDEAFLGKHPADKAKHGKTLEYAPPISEFNMLATHLKAGEKESIQPIDGPTVMVVTGGAGKMHAANKTLDISEGYVYFVGHGVGLDFEACPQELHVFMAYAE